MENKVDNFFESPNVEDDKLNNIKPIVYINTINGSLRHGPFDLDLKGSLPIIKFTVSPWNNSTNEPDFNLKP